MSCQKHTIVNEPGEFKGPMYNIARIEELIDVSENTLQKYQAEYLQNPTSLFAKGMIKNTTERLEELRRNLAFEKHVHERR
jgi:hypothetical protein